jgi:hypothetical protein
LATNYLLKNIYRLMKPMVDMNGNDMFAI